MQRRMECVPDGALRLNYSYNFNGVVDMMGIQFDYPENRVKKKCLATDPTVSGRTDCKERFMVYGK